MKETEYEKFKKAWDKLILILAEELGIIKFLDWLEKKIG